MTKTTKIGKYLFKMERKKLFNEFLPKYNLLIKQNKYINLFQFYTSNGTSFLKFNNINKYGDPLTNHSQMIKNIIKNKKIISGYEIGMKINSYKLIHPIYYEKKFVGAIELGIDPNYFTIKIKEITLNSGCIFAKNLNTNLNKSLLNIKDYKLQTIVNNKLIELIKFIKNKNLFYDKKIIRYKNKIYRLHLNSYKKFANVKFLYLEDMSSFLKKQITILTIIMILVVLLPIIIGIIFNIFFNNFSKKQKEFFEYNLNLIHKKNKELNILHSVFEQLPLTVIITDIDGNIEFVNKWFSTLTQYSQKEAIGQNPKILKTDYTSNEEYKILWDTIKNNQIWSGIFKNKKKDGTIYWESATIFPILNEQNLIINFVGIKEEISEKMMLKQQLVEKENILKKKNQETIAFQNNQIDNYKKTLFALVNIIEMRDPYTGGHSKRVAIYSEMIAKEMEYDKKFCDNIYEAGILHDIGKIMIPDSILLKPGKLTNSEFDLIKKHSNFGYNIVKQIPMYNYLADAIKYHHERNNGKGYPDNLPKKEIPIKAKIIGVADSFDAITTNRIYKNKNNLNFALEELKRCSKELYDKDIIDAAIKVLKNVDLKENTNQLPEDTIEHERFSYYYKDQTTGLFNEFYLKTLLNKPELFINITNFIYISINNFFEFNKKNGWKKGNHLLIDIGKFLNSKYPNSKIFRIINRNFFILTNKNIQEIKNITQDFFNKHDLNITIEKYDFKQKQKLIDKINLVLQNIK